MKPTTAILIPTGIKRIQLFDEEIHSGLGKVQEIREIERYFNGEHLLYEVRKSDFSRIA